MQAKRKHRRQIAVAKAMATLHTAASGIIARRKICMQRGAVEKAAARSIAGVLAGCAARRNVTKIRAAAEAEAVAAIRAVVTGRAACCGPQVSPCGPADKRSLGLR